MTTLKNCFEFGYKKDDMTLEDFYKIQHDFPNFRFPVGYKENESRIYYDKLKYRQENGDILTVEEQTILIFAKIFGSFDQEKNLDEAEKDCLNLLKNVEDNKPKNLDEEKIYYRWINNWQMANVLLGTVFAYKKEFVKASYHFLICGVLDDDFKAMHFKKPYREFMFFVLDQMKNVTPQKANYSGCGFSLRDPMGGFDQKKDKASYRYRLSGRYLIPIMVGKNGEVIAAFLDDEDNYRVRGVFERYENIRVWNDAMTGEVDKYKTFVIDKTYNVFEVDFCLDGNFDELDQVTYRNEHFIELLGKTGYEYALKNKCKVADGFTIRRTAFRKDYLEFVESDGTIIKGV